MRHLRSLKRRADRVEIPSGGVFALCAVVLALPAGLAIGHGAYLDSQGRWIHHHTTSYTTCNDINQNSSLQTEATKAKQNWMSLNQRPLDGSQYGLDEVSLPAQSDCHPGNGDQAEIQLIDGSYGNVGWRASSLNDGNSWTNAAYHPEHTHINFNLSLSWSSFTAFDKRAIVCREIGRVLGVDRVPSSGWAAHGAQNDCMSFDGTPANQVSYEENQTNFTYRDRPWQHSRDLLDQRYGDEGPVVALSGPVKDASNAGMTLSSDSAALRIQATGGGDEDSGVVEVQMLVDGFLQEDPVEFDCTAESLPCAVDTTWEMTPSAYPPGSHTVQIKATDAGGFTRTVSFPLTTAQPGLSAQTYAQLDPAVPLVEVENALAETNLRVIEMSHASAEMSGGSAPPDAGIGAVGTQAVHTLADDMRDEYNYMRSLLAEVENAPDADLDELDVDNPPMLPAEEPQVTSVVFDGTVAPAQAGDLAASIVDVSYVEEPPTELDDEIPIAETDPANDGEIAARAGNPERFWSPRSGHIVSKAREDRTRAVIVQRFKWYNQDAIDAFEDDSAYEHDLKEWNGRNRPKDEFWQHPNCGDEGDNFWADRPYTVEGGQWLTNFGDRLGPYVDTQASDSCQQEDLTMGLYYPQLLSPDKRYVILWNFPRGDVRNSSYQLDAQEVERHCDDSPFCVFNTRGYGPLVGRSKGQMKECRHWHKGEDSRLCD